MLAGIVAAKKQSVAKAKREFPLQVLQGRLAAAPPPRPFAAALEAPGLSLIAEIKRASPSRGDFGLAIPVEELAVSYRRGGARAISVLTEEQYFYGSVADLLAVRRAVDLPVLRKDFIVDRWQLFETRLLPADAVLLIAALLPGKLLAEFLQLCQSLGLAALVETHNAEEVQHALSAGAKIIGVNNRNLHTFEIDPGLTGRMAGLIPAGVLLVSESGLVTAADVSRAAAAGAKAVLVGEALVRAADPVEAARILMGEA
ncbi:MAG: Indole-3-glycerol phosphate synthase [Syntrophomonadaceae bacterium]|nr:Indole-3-glycerol phosphate synthase [Bacillota bacterium]